jgi:hypothetical protein
VFEKGTSGNPKGRLPGTKNRATIEAREFANKLIDDDEYREALRRRIIAGSLHLPCINRAGATARWTA